jgi:NAD(P)-dependent dehydrogenase (short-subunit alcohol dehydrogenase family)
MDLQLKGKTALVTGSTAGIGFAIASGLAAEGARVVVNGRRQPAVDEARQAIADATGSTDVHGFAGDLAAADAAEALVRAWPDVDILVNNLGIFEPKPFEAIPDADWTRLFEVNVLSGVRLARAYLPRMRALDWGRILFISSESAFQIPAEMVHYGVTKAAQVAVARGIAESVAGTGITVNSVLPGPTRSRGVGDFVAALAAQAGQSTAQVEADFFATARPTSLLKRFETPEEIASLTVYLASPLASGTTGAALRVDGGTVKSAY